jgi:hypothetical protein
LLKKLYIYRQEFNCVTHDGYIQIGFFNHTVEEHIRLCPTIYWVETYWLPDVFKNRYKRPSMQAHMRVSGEKSTLETN